MLGFGRAKEKGKKKQKKSKKDLIDIEYDSTLSLSRKSEYKISLFLK